MSRYKVARTYQDVKSKMEKRLLPGKVPSEILTKIVFNKMPLDSERVIVGPALGQDAAIIRVGDRDLIITTDPITGSIKSIGWLAVHINANDVATHGVPPRWMLTTILLPKESTESMLDTIVSQIRRAAEELGIFIIGGHTEVTDFLEQPIIVGTMIGETKKGHYVTSAGASPGDLIILTKYVGIEGTSIIAEECESYLSKYMSHDLIENAKKFKNYVSVVKDAIIAYDSGGVVAMHDPTEGGISNALHELADASSVGFKVFYEKLNITQATQKICEIFSINPLELISSGALLIVVKREFASTVKDKLSESGIPAEIIGEILNDTNKRVILKNETEQELRRPDTDALWFALSCK